MISGDPPWHPFWVHFPIALWLVGSAVLTVALIARRENWGPQAWLLLVLAAIFSIPAALTGQNDLTAAGVDGMAVLERHELLGNSLPWLMGLIVLYKGHTVLRKKNGFQPPDWIWCLAALLVSALVLYTGYLGGILVYDSGLRF